MGKKKGATEADCKDLAKTTCKEVVDEQIKDQKVIDSQSNGSECDKLGVKEVTRTVKHYHKRVKQWTASKKTITLQLDVDTIQQLASPHTIATARRTGSGGSGVVTDMHSVCRFFMLCFVLFSRKRSCIT